MLLLFLYVRVIRATPILLDPRQIAVPQATESDDGEEYKNYTSPLPLALIITISSLLALGIGLGCWLHMRRRRRRALQRTAEGVQVASLISLRAEDLANAGSRSRRTGGSATVVGNGTGNGRRARRSRGRALRRTESGRSVKTLPEYSKEAGDEELVLVRRQSGSMSDTYEDDIQEELEDSMEMTQTAVPITIRSASPSRSRSRSHSRSGDIADNIPLTTRSAPLLGQSMETLQSQGWGEAPTYLEAMSSHNPDAPLPPQVPAPRPSALQRTATGFRDLISKPFAPGSFRLPTSQPTQQRDRGPSTSSSLLHPTTSRYSTASTSTEYPSPWASSHSLLISPPVPNTAMRASFDGSDIPRGGLNEAQMKFLSSKEAVALVGVKLEDVPSHKRRRSAMSGQATPASDAGSESGDVPPPSWQQLDGERRQSEAFERRNLATPIQLEDGSATEPVAPGLGTLEAGSAESTVVTNEDVSEEAASNAETTTEPAKDAGPVKETQPVNNIEPATELKPKETKPGNE